MALLEPVLCESCSSHRDCHLADDIGLLMGCKVTLSHVQHITELYDNSWLVRGGG